MLLKGLTMGLIGSMGCAFSQLVDIEDWLLDTVGGFVAIDLIWGSSTSVSSPHRSTGWRDPVARLPAGPRRLWPVRPRRRPPGARSWGASWLGGGDMRKDGPSINYLIVA